MEFCGIYVQLDSIFDAKQVQVSLKYAIQSSNVHVLRHMFVKLMLRSESVQAQIFPNRESS